MTSKEAISEKELKIPKIAQGTVIDHITAGRAFETARALRLDKISNEKTVSLVTNLPSHRYGRKDIIKIDNTELSKSEVEAVSLISQSATINIIRNFHVAEKFKPKVPKRIVGMVRCTDPLCASNIPNEPIKPVFLVEGENPLRLRCDFCDGILESDDVVKQLVI